MNLKSINMDSGKLYETIITTHNSDLSNNAAPIGVIPKNEDTIVLYLYKGSSTLENIKRDRKFTVNIIQDPLTFVNSTISNPPNSLFGYLGEYNFLKNSDAFYTAQIVDISVVNKEDKIGSSQLNVITAKVNEIKKINACVNPLNRAIYVIIDSLINLTRIDMVHSKQREVFLKRLDESSRIVNRVGGVEEKEAMKKIREQYDNYK